MRPQLTVATSVASLIKVKYAIHTEVQQQIKALLVPCNLFGNFYQEIRNEAPASIGCQDAFKLGRISYNQYEEISALRDPAYRSTDHCSSPGISWWFQLLSASVGVPLVRLTLTVL